MTHEKNNFGGRAEHPGSDEQKISEMLGGLKRVEAPKDFDFHLKARIANARPADYQRAGLFPILKYAVPLALFLVVGAGIFGLSFYDTGNSTVVSVSETPEPTVPPVQESAPMVTVPLVTPPDVATATPLPDAGSRSIEKKENERFASRTPVEPGGGSRDSHPRTPGSRDLPSRSADQALGVAENAITPVKRLSAKEALKLIGIDADFENNGWTVKTVKANEVGGILGVKPGYRIKTIEGKPLDQKTEFEGGIKLSRMQVQRDGATVDLVPQNKPGN